MFDPRTYEAQRIVRDQLRADRCNGTAARGTQFVRFLEKLGGPESVLFGTLPDGTALRIAPALLTSHLALAGRSGAGKSYFLTSLVTSRALLAHHVIVHDVKGETITLLQATLAHLAGKDPALSARLTDACLMLEAGAAGITPVALFRAQAGVGTAFLAELLTAAFVIAATDPISGGMREALRQLFECAIVVGAPFSAAFFDAVLLDGAYRAWLVERIAEPHLRAFLHTVERDTPPQQREAVRRRIRAFASFPLYRALYGVPPAVVDTLGFPKQPALLLGNFAPNLAVPFTVAMTRAAWALIHILLEIAGRPRGSRPLVLVLEELPALLTAAPELAPLLLHACRTARSSGVAIWIVGQSFSGLPHVLRDELTLNAAWLVSFQTTAGDFAETIAAHLPSPRPVPVPVVRHALTTLPARHAFLTVKGVGAVPFRSGDLALPAGDALDEAAAQFAAQFAPHAIPVARAAALLGAWDRDFVRAHCGGGSGRKTSARELLGMGDGA